jgi:hypothetical protein
MESIRIKTKCFINVEEIKTINHILIGKTNILVTDDPLKAYDCSFTQINTQTNPQINEDITVQAFCEGDKTPVTLFSGQCGPVYIEKGIADKFTTDPANPIVRIQLVQYPKALIPQTLIWAIHKDGTMELIKRCDCLEVDIK